VREKNVKSDRFGGTTANVALRIRLLGAFELESDAAEVQLPARKSEALLAVLALRPGVAFAREWLAALLWPEVPESQARTSLRQAVGHLRKLNPGMIVAGADRLHLQPGVAWIDTAESERIADRPPSEREPLAALLRGPLLDGFPAIEQPFVDWLAEERARWSEHSVARLEECLAALSAAGASERAIVVGAHLLELDPTRESVHRALMRLELERGDRTAALRRYQRCRDALERHLGVAPSAETDRLRATIADEATAAHVGVRAKREGRFVSDLGGRLRVAVVPFRAEPDSDTARLLAAGLSEDVTTELARFRQLALIARGSIADAATRLASPEAIGEETGARLVVSGSVRVMAERARITAALTDTTTGLEVWSERWDAAVDDPFTVLDRLTRSLVSALSLRIDEARLRSTDERPRHELEAYECWLRGVECLRQGTPATDEEARGFFEQALTRTPGFARAHAGISLSHFNDWSCQAWERWDERERKSFESARRAVELDDSDHVTHTILARIHVYRGEFALGERHVERALALNQNDADMLLHASIVLAQLGDAARATDLAAAALLLNPKRPDWYFPAAAFAHLVAREPERVLEIGSQAPDAMVDGRAHLAIAAAHLGDAAAAREHVANFLHNFGRKIVPTREFEASEPVNWLRRITPFRRSADTEYVMAGLARAGLTIDQT
jgi:DNA-binding SARP family transcriptional activator